MAEHKGVQGLHKYPEIGEW